MKPIAPHSNTTRTDWILGLVLVLLTCGVYLPSAANGFVWYDDPSYLIENAQVNSGFTWEGLRWAFSEAHSANWHPLTWLSHMLDCQLFGLEARGHHLMSACIHGLNVLLCFLVLRAASGARWASAICAALFGLHPLRVQSVAWASERKDLLAGLFFFLCLWSYIRYARNPGKLNYSWVALSLALGLMCKPMLVTLPALLLVFDFWPLGRWSPQAARQLIVEKLPLFGLVLLSIVVTILAQDEGGAFRFARSLPLAERIPHAASSVLQYVRSSFWPEGLACFYPHPSSVDPDWNPWLQSLLPFGLGFGALLMLRHFAKCCPEMICGALWMLLMLAPVIGIVQVGEQSWADRYAYLPTIGLYIAICMPLAKLAQERQLLRLPLAAIALLAIACLSWRTHQEIPHWKSTESLARHALAVTDDNYVAHLGLAGELMERGLFEEAQEQLDATQAIQPESTDLMLSYSMLYEAQLLLPEAIQLYRDALVVYPKWPLMRMRLGIALSKSGHSAESIEHLELALADNEGNVDLIFNLALAYLHAERPGDAIPLLNTCLERSEKFFEARIARGEAYFQLRDYAAAKRNLLRGARVSPEKAATRLAMLLAAAPDAQLRDGKQALTWASKALQLNQDAAGLEALAAAQAEVGRYADAQQSQVKAIERLPKGQRQEANDRLAGYREGRPYRLPE